MILVKNIHPIFLLTILSIRDYSVYLDLRLPGNKGSLGTNSSQVEEPKVRKIDAA